MRPRIPPPSHRHAAPSGPWPWMDLGSNFAPFHPVQPPEAWKGYPQSLFPNWTPDQVQQSKMMTGPTSGICSIHQVDVLDDGSFSEQGTYTVPHGRDEDFWESIQQERSEGIRVRSLFVDNISAPILQMLGTKYNIEPFFFTSSLNWIPSRSQEDVQPGRGDHVTITLGFIRTIPTSSTAPSSLVSNSEKFPPPTASQPISVDQEIDTQVPLLLRSPQAENSLLLDLLAIHIVRTPESSTLISYHPPSTWQTTSGKRLQSLTLAAGESVYWQKIFKATSDPTFILLAILWYALYAWDEALEVLYQHITWLESRVMSTHDMLFVRELHTIEAHLLHYESLLQDFHKSVVFVLDTPNPAIVSPSDGIQESQEWADLMKRECHNLMSEIDRLERSRVLQNSRLRNVMQLAFATVKIEERKDTRKLTEASVRDSAAMKQISYLTMVFFPAHFVAELFRMNVKEINPSSLGTLSHYAETALPLTALTIWILVAIQKYSPFHETDSESMWNRLCWPVLYVRRRWNRRRR